MTACLAEDRVGHLRVNSDLPILQVQLDVFHCDAPLIGCFGSWRSGKTRAGALKILQLAALNPWRPSYGAGDNPTSMVVTETAKVMRDSAYRELMQLLPEECVRQKWTSPSNLRVRLVNGHDIVFRPWSGAIEGGSNVGVWVDEAHKLDGPDGPEAVWRNLVMRATDTRAPRCQVIATGLPEYGYLSEIFDHPSTPERSTFLCSLRDNFYLTPEKISALYSSTTVEEAEVVIDGKWRKPPTVIYYAFSDRNLVDCAGDPRLPADLSIDLGDKGAMLVSQRVVVTIKEPLPDGQTRESRGRGVLIVDELLPDQKSVKDALRDFLRDRPWQIRGPDSSIYVDPKADRDELDAIRELTGAGLERGPRLVRQPPKLPAYRVEYGHRCVNSAFRDYWQNRRLFINSALPRTQRSLIPSLRQHRRKPNGDVYRDNVVDHVLDTLRYIVVDQLPLRERGGMIRNAA